ncbi:MAG: L,D-transpeptidase family protein [Chloroflexi bacterium]|nr:L,D-transpeptidase family protein [Chloroflexota bacterium]
MNTEYQSNNFFLIQVLSFVIVAAFLMAALATWVLNLPVETAAAAPGPTSTAVTDSSSPLPTPEPTTIPTTVAPTATPPADQTTTPPTPPPPDPLSHTVQEGETLGIIAQAYRVSVEDLIAVNELDNPDLLYVGWTLTIPDGSPISATIQGPSPTEVPIQPTPIPTPALPEQVSEERWIDVDLSEQLLTAYEGQMPVHSYLISTGLPATPTPVGQFRIWIKLRYDDMAGADYYIEDVPFVMYFYGGYGLHGVTWHGNFGHPMSHGCVNQPTDQAEWLFDFADVGTLVNIHE